ncbi:MAG: pyridoxal phosphate-dependent aminotransferase, partial [Calditrichaeota bacterium]|nr:pyridoxal phosphate-dependent aminotransferase [Calditrichota bacterium]
KIITTSGGGMLLSDEKDLIDRARFLATQARDDAPHYEHSEIGFNYRMSNILAAIGRGQLKVLNERIRRKRQIHEYYLSRLGQIPGICFQPELPETFSNRWLTAITVDPEITGVDREAIRTELEKHQIESRPLWKPMHLQPVYQSAPAYVNGVSEKLFRFGLCLPSGTALSNSDLDRICSIIEKKITF